ncbi:hypothetical protein [Reichenbachiella ulvae]|uniref:Uncharacterized protein n=1 Tax=Reichenbachiella ulvae TaxID=2980104 RepID=A0ABT3CV81_9BACT|nr:hypothetical protein [Reichenbachiella ulvae]MCV9387429.1 hypothetical protein [Reichenbachiella ulvae]
MLIQKGDILTLLMPSRIESNHTGYACLIDLYHQANTSDAKRVFFDFRRTTWFEANLCAVLGAIRELLLKNGKSFDVTNIGGSIKTILQKNKFLCDFGHFGMHDQYNTTVSYQKFNPTADGAFMTYIKNEMLAKPDFPSHSPALGKKISESIFELYENARTHGNCDLLHTCGQYFPQKIPARLDITIVDMGITIKKNVKEYLNQPLSGVEAIVWALQYGNTTKTGNISGGLGLDIMFKFIQENNGKVQIISSDGYWESRRGAISTHIFENFFPGTIVNIEFNLSDTNSYLLKEEISLDGIF